MKYKKVYFLFKDYGTSIKCSWEITKNIMANNRNLLI